MVNSNAKIIGGLILTATASGSVAVKYALVGLPPDALNGIVSGFIGMFLCCDFYTNQTINRMEKLRIKSGLPLMYSGQVSKRRYFFAKILFGILGLVAISGSAVTGFTFSFIGTFFCGSILALTVHFVEEKKHLEEIGRLEKLPYHWP